MTWKYNKGKKIYDRRRSRGIKGPILINEYVNKHKNYQIVMGKKEVLKYKKLIIS